jgi:Glyoxalase superfamily protein
VPTLRITNDARSKAFDVDGLRLQVVWEHRCTPQLPVLLCSKRDEMGILLTANTGDCPVGGLVHLDVPDVDAWYAALLVKGVPAQEPPNASVQRLRDMTVVDPDGDKPRFCSRLEGWSRV